ncbi:hypothetical protein [Hyphomicrobium sp.]|uniref:hypothetical protein n=1 Tax=Hyphomicrobium sp. TaxID=82 RepID=UPI002D78579A|nr:hypothetical protein [Hyphomicrobium sp.]HET6390791.1 hypothetical protein [Hyphomicrobium sp.]
MKVNSSLSGNGATPRERALMILRQAIAKRETELAAMQPMKPPAHVTGATRHPASQGGK